MSPTSQQYIIPNYSIFDKTIVFEVGVIRNIKLQLRSQRHSQSNVKLRILRGTGKTVKVSGQDVDVIKGPDGGMYYKSPKSGKRISLNRDGTKRS